MSAIAADVRRSSPRGWLVPVGAIVMLLGMFVTRGVQLNTAQQVDEGGGGFCPDSAFVDYLGNHYPDESCTGWEPTGVSLTTYSGSCTLTGTTTIDSKTINCNPLNINANNITVTRSQINGVVRMNSASRTGILFEDVTLDGQNSGGGGGDQQCFGGNSSSPGGANAGDFVMRRIHGVGCEIFFYGRGATLVDSYVHANSCSTQLPGSDAHREVVLIHTGEVTMTRNNFEGDLRFDSCTSPEGTSAIAVIYVGKNFWPSADDVLMDGNRFGFLPDTGSGVAFACIYPGKEVSDLGNPETATNIRWKNNVFARNTNDVCALPGAGGAVFENTDSNTGGSCFENNVFEDDGEVLTPSGADACP